MKTLNPTKMILPAILAVGLTLYSFSLFTGSAFMRKGAQPPAKAEKLLSGLSNQFPASIQQWRGHIEASAGKNGLDPQPDRGRNAAGKRRQRGSGILERRGGPHASHCRGTASPRVLSAAANPAFPAVLPQTSCWNQHSTSNTARVCWRG